MNNFGNKQTMAENLKYYLDLNHKTRSDLCKDLNLPYTTVSEWLQGKKYPRIDKIEMVANYFNIEKSDLIEIKTYHGKCVDNTLYLLNDLTDDELQEVTKYIEFIKSKRNK